MDQNLFLDKIDKIVKEAKEIFNETNSITERNSLPSN
jgi:hypothetical protein